MMTWKIWRALHNPPALHPVFQRTVLLPPPTLNRRSIGWASLVVNLVLALGQYSPTILLLLMPFILIFTGITYGIDCAIRVGSAIAKEHENSTFNLLSLSPGGALGASWAMCTSMLYRNRDFSRLHTIMRGTIIIGMVAIIIVSSLVLLVDSAQSSRTTQTTFPVIVHIVDLTAIMLALYIEYVQSAVLGSLVGMYIPTYTQNRIDTTLYAFGAFLFLQVMTYLLTFLIGFVIFPGSYDRLNVMGDYTEISLTVIRLATFFSIREVIISGLWRTLVQRLNALPSELDLTMQFAP